MATTGGFENLQSYQTTKIVYDFTVAFCQKYRTSLSSPRTFDQMVQAARSGKQNIAEGCAQSRVSSKGEIKLLGVALASLRELAADFEDFLRQHNLPIWDKNSPRAKEIRNLAYTTNRSYTTYESYVSNPEEACNTALCLVNQATFLLSRQINSAEAKFINEGGYTENLFKKRLNAR